MIPESLKRLLPSAPRLLRPAHPAVAVEITERAVSAARGSSAGLSAWFSARLPEGAVRSAAVQQNLIDREPVLELLRAARRRLAPQGAPVALVLPDCVAKIAVLQVDALPRRREEVDDLVAWRLKKTLPYRADEARLSWESFAPDDDGKRLLLAAALRRRTLEEYEGLLAEAGFETGAVSTATLALAERLPEPEERDSLLLNVGRSWFSMLVTDGRRPLFFRSKAIPEGERAAGLREAFVARELVPTVEYYRRRVGGRGLGRLALHAAGGGAAELEEALRGAPGVEPALFPATELAAPVPEELSAELRARLAAVATMAGRGWPAQPVPEARALGGAA